MTDNLGKAFGPSPECPDLEVLAAWREQQEPRERGMQTHIDDCGYCQAELALLDEELTAVPVGAEVQDVAWIVSALRGNPPLGKTSLSRGWLSRLTEYWHAQPVAALSWVGAMACLLLVAGLSLRDDAGLGPIPGAETGTPVFRSTQMDLEGPLGDITAPPAGFRWSAAGGGAARYQVRLMEVDGTVLWEGTSEGTSLEAPANVAAIAVPGKTLLWQVQAIDQQGSVVAESTRGSFRVPVEGLE